MHEYTYNTASIFIRHSPAGVAGYFRSHAFFGHIYVSFARVPIETRWLRWPVSAMLDVIYRKAVICQDAFLGWCDDA